MLEKINNEMELWKGFFENKESFQIAILLDIFASMDKDKRNEAFIQVEETLKNLEIPISKDQSFIDVEEDLKSYKEIRSEAAVAYRTLAWAKEKLETSYEDLGEDVSKSEDNVNIVLETSKSEDIIDTQD